MSSNIVSTDASNMADTSLNRALRGCFGCSWVAIDGQRRIADFSPEAEHLTGLKARQLRNRPFSILPEPLQRAIQATFSTGKAIRARYIRLSTTTEGEITVRLRTVAIRTAKRRCAAVLIMMSDQGSAGKLEQTVQRLQRLASIGMLSASMAHEIKNALVAVRTFLDLLLEKNRDAELADVVGREMGRIDSLVSQMLKFVGPSKPTFAATALHELLDQSLRLLEHQLQGKLISLRRAYAASPDVVRGNSHQLQQAFLNLFLNAADALGPSGELDVATELVSPGGGQAGARRIQNQALVRITIRDSGVGIAPENMNHLFEPFFTTKKNGTGLGLSITRNIIHEHNGTIAAKSQVNQGTVFQIHLPLLDKTP